jgi:PAS domain S-box-containing protein
MQQPSHLPPGTGHMGDEGRMLARLAAIVETSADAIIGKDLNGIITDWNPAAERLYGYAANEVLGRPISMLAPPGHEAEIEGLMEQLRRGEVISHHETRRRRKDGTLIDVSLAISPIRDRSGRLVGASTIARDITAQKRMAGLVAGQMRVLERIVQDQPLDEVLDDLARVIEAGTGRRVLASILLLDADGTHLRHGAAPSLPASYTAAIDGVAIGPQAGSCGTAAYRREPVIVEDIATDPLWVDFRDLALRHGLRACWSTPILGAGGDVLGTFALYYTQPCIPRPEDQQAVDLLTRTAAVALERARATAERERLFAGERLSRGHLEVALEAGRMGTWEWDAGTHRVAWSPQLERIHGLTPGTFAGTFDAYFSDVHPADRERVRAAIAASLEQGEHHLEYRIVWPDGSLHWVEARGRVVRDKAGKPAGMRGVCMDVTARKEAEAERERLLASEQAARAEAEGALRVRDALVSFATHDLRNPLTTIKGQAQMLGRLSARDRLTPEGLAEGLAAIDSASKTMEALIGELLDTVRLQAGQQLELRPEPTDLVALARRCAAEQQQTTNRHTLHVVPRVSTLMGEWDVVRIQRVIGNLLSNAIKYSPEGGAITMTVGRRGRGAQASAELSVHDCGLGIPPADLPHVFERFHRAANVTRAMAGSGIGLAGARQIVEQHGGTIAVESSEGSGSTFTVRLPLSTAAGGSA